MLSKAIWGKKMIKPCWNGGDWAVKLVSVFLENVVDFIIDYSLRVLILKEKFSQIAESKLKQRR